MLIEGSSRSLAMMQTVVNDLITKCESISAQFDVLSTKYVALAARDDELTSRHEVLSTKYVTLAAKNDELRSRHEKLASGHSNLEAEYYTDKRPTLLYSALSITSHLLAETAPPTVYAKDEAKYFVSPVKPDSVLMLTRRQEKVALLTAGVRPWTERVGKAVLAQPLLEALLEPDSILTFTALIPVADRIVRCHPELNRTAWLRKFMKLEAYDYTRHTNTHGSLPSESTLALEWVFAAYGPVECRTIFNELGSADSDGAAVSQSQLSRFAHFL